MAIEKSNLGILRAKMDQELGTSYIPKLIARQPKLFSPGMLQLISRGERTFTRVDERMGSSPYLECVRNTLLNLEALSAAIIDGAEVDLMGLLLHDIKKRGKVMDLGDLRVSSSTSSRAIQYRDYIETHNSCSDMEDFVFSKDSILRLHEDLNYSRDASFRRAYRGEGTSSPDVLHPNLPQQRTLPPERIEEYMEDLYEFCNTDYYTPQIQAGLAHFQIEYIRPFKSRIVALGRHISYIIYAKRNFTNNILVAVAIESVRRIDNPIDNLKANQKSPARQSPLELWVYHGANLLLRESQMVLDMERTYREIEMEWRTKVARVRRDDICDILLHDLLAHPIINAKYVAERCDKTLPAANDALKKLVSSGILRAIDSRKRNRYFFAVDVLRYYQKLMEDIIPRGWLPGMELFNS